jgi:nitroreductase
VCLIEALIAARQHVGLRHLEKPAPDAQALRELLACASGAPDHNRLRPWRFVVLSWAARPRLAEAFAASLLKRDPSATPEQLAAAADKAWNAPVLLLAIADLRAEDSVVTLAERYVSLGAALQNLLLAAQERGFASGLSSGRSLQAATFRDALGLVDGEEAICFVGIGTSRALKPRRRRPAVDEFVTWL